MRDFPAWACWLAVVLFLSTGCMSRTADKRHEDDGKIGHIHKTQNNVEFIKENIKNMDYIYYEEYHPHPYPFVVDTETGSAVIQDLIDTDLAGRQIDSLTLESLNRNERILKIYNYVLTEYDYIVEPKTWPTMDETIKWKKGDCKGLSMLLMSLLIASGFDTHAAISNGHMWVNVYRGGAWHVLELDNDPERVRIYNIPGFYNRPLFRIYEDRTEKRLRKK